MKRTGYFSLICNFSSYHLLHVIPALLMWCIYQIYLNVCSFACIECSLVFFLQELLFYVIYFWKISGRLRRGNFVPNFTGHSLWMAIKLSSVLREKRNILNEELLFAEKVSRGSHLVLTFLFIRFDWLKSLIYITFPMVSIIK